MKTYQCICGRVFDDPQKFNGHKQGCEEHIVNKYGSLECYYKIKNRNRERSSKTLVEKNKRIKAESFAEWLSERHTCERCGKVMTEKFGSGRFCSRSCSNSRQHSSEIIEKIRSSSLSESNQKRHKNKEDQLRLLYNQNPKACCVCGKILTYKKRNNLTCSKKCVCKLQSMKKKELYKAGIQHTNVRYRYKYGTYNNIHCDSSWELAFVLYLQDHNITFVRNTKESFEYVYKGESHNFFPDFIIDGVYYELKNYKSELTDAKKNCFPEEKQLRILYYTDIKPYLDYVNKTYGKHFYYMYDRKYPSWMDTLGE